MESDHKPEMSAQEISDLQDEAYSAARRYKLATLKLRGTGVRASIGRVVEHPPKSAVPLSVIKYEEFVGRIRAGGFDLVYPSRNTSYFLDYLPPGERAATNFWGCVAMLMILSSFILPFVLGSWWWLLLFPGGVVFFSSNRTSLDQFVLESLAKNEAFFYLARDSHVRSGLEAGNRIGDQIFVLPDGD